MTPAHESLGTGGRQLFEREQRLVDEEELRVLDGAPHVAGQHVITRPGVLPGVVQLAAAAARLLRLVRRHLGVVDQPGGLTGDVAGHGDADAAGDGQVLAAVGEGHGDRAGDPVPDQWDGVAAQIPAQHHELVAAEAGYRVAAPRESREPAASFGEHQVAGVVTVEVVDPFEVVHIDAQHRHAGRMPFHRDQRLGEAVHQREPVRQPGQRVVQGLVSQRFLGRDLRGHIARDAEGADDPAALVAQRHLGAGHPGVRATSVGLPFQLPHDRLAGADDQLLVGEGGGGVILTEEVEVGFPDQLGRAAARGVRGDPACADQQEAAERVLEVDPLLGTGQQVAHAGELELTHWPARQLARRRQPGAAPRPALRSV